MKIYTRRGDEGMTRLADGRPVGKDALRLEAIGSIDELNAGIGKVLAQALEPPLREALEEIQDGLFRLGADLARPQPSEDKPLVDKAVVGRLEQWIDRFSRELPELRHFILPGGTPVAADLQWVRAVCRRAERRSRSLAAEEPEAQSVLPYLNRLGDLLFVLARWANLKAGGREVIWKADSRG